jgi:phosphoglucosamine mutase
MLEQVQKELSGQGRVLIRPSGTEPLLRVMVEANTEASARALARRLAECVPAAA